MLQHHLSTKFALAPVSTIWQRRSLIWQLATRDVEARYRGSLLGIIWAAALPVMMFGVYLFVFTTVLRARWDTPTGTSTEVALFIFSGLLLFTLFSETVNRAPYLIAEAPYFVKKVVFPVEILPVVALIAAMVPLLVSAVVMFAVMLVTATPLSWTILYFPLLVLPVGLLALGMTWFFSAMAVYLPDLRHVIGVLVTMLMFLTPIFYPASALPKEIKWLHDWSPLAWTIEMAKDVLFWGRQLDWTEFALVTGVCAAFAWLGYAFFMASKQGFADVM